MCYTHDTGYANMRYAHGPSDMYIYIPFPFRLTTLGMCKQSVFAWSSLERIHEKLRNILRCQKTTVTQSAQAADKCHRIRSGMECGLRFYESGISCWL